MVWVAALKAMSAIPPPTAMYEQRAGFTPQRPRLTGSCGQRGRLNYKLSWRRLRKRRCENGVFPQRSYLSPVSEISVKVGRRPLAGRALVLRTEPRIRVSALRASIADAKARQCHRARSRQGTLRSWGLDAICARRPSHMRQDAGRPNIWFDLSPPARLEHGAIVQKRCG